MNISLLHCNMGAYYLVTHWKILDPTCSVPLLFLVLSILISPSENLSIISAHFLLPHPFPSCRCASTIHTLPGIYKKVAHLLSSLLKFQCNVSAFRGIMKGSASFPPDDEQRWESTAIVPSSWEYNRILKISLPNMCGLHALVATVNGHWCWLVSRKQWQKGCLEGWRGGTTVGIISETGNHHMAIGFRRSGKGLVWMST